MRDDIGTRTAAELVSMMQHTAAGPLPRFVAARLAEDEAAAKAAEREIITWGGQRPSYAKLGFSVGDLAQVFSPARVLREVEAACRILWEYMNCGEDYAAGPGLHVAVLSIAAIWSDHPDYDARWQDTGW